VQISAIGADTAAPAYGQGDGRAGGSRGVPGGDDPAASLVFGPEDQLFNRLPPGATLPVMPVTCGETQFQPV
jgi:hypothetical protein